MPKTRVSCPNCRQPVAADVDQLFDLNVDPSAKQRFLSGAFNFIQCSTCGYQGMLSTPIVYHDPEKELLMTFVPQELGLSRDDQERTIGSLINQVVNKLPQEKRKGYLLNPQGAFTLQGMVERVLEADGITKEMIQAQQQKINLIRRLANTTDESARVEIARQEDALIDAEFFSLLSRLIEAAMGAGDKESAQRLAELQNSLLPITTFGRQVQEQSAEIQATIQELQSLGKELTREKLLELLEKAPNDLRLSVMVSLTRPVMDYAFFQLLSERLDRSRGEGRTRLVELRTKLLEMTQEIDRQVEERRQEARKLVEAVLQTGDVSQAIQQNPQVIDDFFMQEVNRMLEEARKQGDLQKSAKLNQIIETAQKLNAPPELALIEAYLDAGDDQARQAFLETHQAEITVEFLETLANIAAQVQSGDDAEIAAQVRAANRQALRFSMSRNLSAN
jgi:hypothetical protein